jgi:hypothetical protein
MASKNDLLSFYRFVEATNSEHHPLDEETLQMAADAFLEMTSITGGITNQLLDSKAGILKVDESIETTVEIFEKSIREEAGEYAYIVYAPGENGTIFVNIGMRGGVKLFEVLVNYAISQNEMQQTQMLIGKLSSILINAQIEIDRQHRLSSQRN